MHAGLWMRTVVMQKIQIVTRVALQVPVPVGRRGVLGQEPKGQDRRGLLRGRGE